MMASEIAKGRKRRILTDFRLDKISAVDNPCQEGARVAIIKRREEPRDEREPLGERIRRLVRQVMVEKGWPVDVVDGLMKEKGHDPAPTPAPSRPQQDDVQRAVMRFKDEIEKPKVPAFGDPAEVKKAFDALQIALDKQTDALAALNGNQEKQQQRRQNMHSDPFITHVARIQKRDRCTRSEALMCAAEEAPEALAEYRSQPVPADNRAELIRKGRQRQAGIDKRVREVMARDRCARSAALQTLHDESPELWEDHFDA